MSSKSEYKRLAMQIPDVVKVIREHALEEAIAAVGANYHIMPKYKETTGVKLHNSVIDEDIRSIENLKNK